MRNNWLIYLSVLLFFAACSNKAEKLKTLWPYGIRYEVFVRAFADSNGDSIGDINGLRSRLDYLQDLGVNGLWLMPVMPSPSYHKYDVTDYMAIDPEYGTMEDFQSLVREAHDRGIRIIIDLVLNHSGREHPWFQEAVKGLDNPYRNYYVWARRDSVRAQLSKKTVTLDSDNITQWHPVNGDTISEQYYGFFWGGMPDLNMDNPRVREEFVRIGRFWLDSMDVDGFRLDAARHIFPSERAADNHEFWKWFRREMQTIKPDVYLVGEVWAGAAETEPYRPGLPSLFNFDLAYDISRVVNAGRDTLGLAERCLQNSKSTDPAADSFLDATFLRNHDQDRIRSVFNGDLSRCRLASSILFTLPGTPYVYYGEEIGMLGKKPDEQIREPFLWEAGVSDTSRARWVMPAYSTEDAVVPLALQQRDSASLFHHYRKWMRFRNRDAVLTNGTIVPVPGKPELLTFIRRHGDESRLILHNLSDKNQQWSGKGLPKSFTKILFSAGGGSLNSGVVELPPRSSVVLD